MLYRLGVSCSGPFPTVHPFFNVTHSSSVHSLLLRYVLRCGEIAHLSSGRDRSFPILCLTRVPMMFIPWHICSILPLSSNGCGGNWVTALMGCGRRWLTARSPGDRPQPLLGCISTCICTISYYGSRYRPAHTLASHVLAHRAWGFRGGHLRGPPLVRLPMVDTVLCSVWVRPRIQIQLCDFASLLAMQYCLSITGD